MVLPRPLCFQETEKKKKKKEEKKLDCLFLASLGLTFLTPKRVSSVEITGKWVLIDNHHHFQNDQYVNTNNSRQDQLI